MADSLASLTLRDFLERLAARTPTPGGGSASALAGATAAALAGMVLELTAGRTNAVDHVTLASLIDEAARLRAELTDLVELDATAYDAVVAARRLPRQTPAEVLTRRAGLADATRAATRAPLRIAAAASEVLALTERLATFGSSSAISDVGVAGELAAAAVRGAALNVHVNVPFLPEDDAVRIAAQADIDRLLADVDRRAAAVRDAVAERG